MSVFVVLVLVAAVVVVGLLALAVTGRGGFAAPLADPVRLLPPVLLPPEPSPSDVDRLRFSPGLRGYRMDQVDEALQVLSVALAERDAEIARLRSRHGVISGTARNPE
ncbi:DivIVA domain-containing protein [Citricoccus nitrophenolicus]|uniref:DivIVA domain-containing protein n=1 Tax=Citricoccus nitrophenolicus TaxID=863575 RepID=A0ABV0IJ09_9MICC